MLNHGYAAPSETRPARTKITQDSKTDHHCRVVIYILPIVSPLQDIVAYIGYDKPNIPYYTEDISKIGTKGNQNMYDPAIQIMAST